MHVSFSINEYHVCLKVLRILNNSKLYLVQIRLLNNPQRLLGYHRDDYHWRGGPGSVGVTSRHR